MFQFHFHFVLFFYFNVYIYILYKHESPFVHYCISLVTIITHFATSSKSRLPSDFNFLYAYRNEISKKQIPLLCYKRIVAPLFQIYNASTHFHKWGPNESPTLENIGPHDIIVDHQFNRFPTRGQQQLNRLFTFLYSSHIPCIYCVYNDGNEGLLILILILIPTIIE